eukprot:COSAG03_NODE_8119_length_835_cov_1.680707_2_plen_32_part_01
MRDIPPTTLAVSFKPSEATDTAFPRNAVRHTN